MLRISSDWRYQAANGTGARFTWRPVSDPSSGAPAPQPVSPGHSYPPQIILPTSPNPLRSIPIQLSVVADDRQVLRQRLGNQHPVKWILVRARQQPCLNTMLHAHCQADKSLAPTENPVAEVFRS